MAHRPCRHTSGRQVSPLDCLSANTRQQIRRSMRLYEKRGQLDIARARDVPEAMSFLDGLKELHRSLLDKPRRAGWISVSVL